MNEPAVQQVTAIDRPTAIGMVRSEVSGLDAPRHAAAIVRHAQLLGYQYLYTVRPPYDATDPVAYALGIAAGLGAAVIVVYDLAHVDNLPSRVCDELDLETVCPAETWVRAAGPVSSGSGAV